MIDKKLFLAKMEEIMKNLSFLFLSLFLAGCISCDEKTNKTKLKKPKAEQEETSPSPRKKLPRGTTLLHRVAKSGDAEKAEALLLEGADPNAMNQYGFTPLHYVGKGNAKTAKVLIKYGANPNLKSNGGLPPLFRAIEFAKVDVVKVLIEAGADVYPTRKFDPYAFDPLIYAKQRKRTREIDKRPVEVRKYETIIKLIEEARLKQVIKNKTPSPSE